MYFFGYFLLNRHFLENSNQENKKLFLSLEKIDSFLLNSDSDMYRKCLTQDYSLPNQFPQVGPQHVNPARKANPRGVYMRMGFPSPEKVRTSSWVSSGQWLIALQYNSVVWPYAR